MRSRASRHRRKAWGASTSGRASTASARTTRSTSGSSVAHSITTLMGHDTAIRPMPAQRTVADVVPHAVRCATVPAAERRGVDGWLRCSRSVDGTGRPHSAAAVRWEARAATCTRRAAAQSSAGLTSVPARANTPTAAGGVPRHPHPCVSTGSRDDRHHPPRWGPSRQHRDPDVVATEPPLSTRKDPLSDVRASNPRVGRTGLLDPRPPYLRVAIRRKS